MDLRCLLLAPLFLVSLALSAQSAEIKLTHDQIQNYLNGQTVIHRSDGKTEFRQQFNRDGTTTYKAAGRDLELGKWSVQGNQYCSQWGPFGWTCYDMTAKGDLITWIAKEGTLFPGKILTK